MLPRIGKASFSRQKINSVYICSIIVFQCDTSPWSYILCFPEILNIYSSDFKWQCHILFSIANTALICQWRTYRGTSQKQVRHKQWDMVCWESLKCPNMKLWYLYHGFLTIKSNELTEEINSVLLTNNITGSTDTQTNEAPQHWICHQNTRREGVCNMRSW